jgi:hypothetical protein
VSTMSDPAETRTTAQVRARTSDTFVERMASIKETKPSFMTTEFWLMIIGVAGLIGLYNYTDNPSLDLWRTCVLCSLIATAYIVSRGLAKSGTIRRDYNADDRDLVRH